MLTGEDAAHFLRESPEECIGTGFYEIDSVTEGGLRCGEVSIVAGVTGYGKTAFAEETALHVSRYDRVLFLPLEMGERATSVRFAAKIERTSPARLQRIGALHHDTIRDLNVRKIITWEFGYEPSAEEIIAATESCGARLVVVDHVRHVDGWLSDRQSARNYGPSKIVSQFKDAAKKLNVHFMLCAQLNRNAYDARAKRPMMSQLLDTSSLEHMASLIMLVHRPFYQRGHLDTVAEILVSKNRHGPCCMLHYRWIGESMTFWSMSEEELAAVDCCKRAHS